MNSTEHRTDIASIELAALIDEEVENVLITTLSRHVDHRSILVDPLIEMSLQTSDISSVAGLCVLIIR